MSQKLSPTPGQTINGLSAGSFASLQKIVPCGSLECRKLASGTVMLYWRITLGGKTTRVSIGAYDSTSPPKKLDPTDKGYSIAAAARAAQAMALTHHTNIDNGGFVGVQQKQHEAEQSAKDRAKAELKAAQAAKQLAAKYTLASLMSAYADYLQSLGRQAVGDVRSITKLHIVDAWPKVAALPANKVTLDQIADMQRRLLELDKGRTANKLRSYVRAAYQVAMAARSKASIPLSFKAFNVTSNPAADTAPDESQNNADKNPLTADELRQYWQIIKPLPDFIGAVLRLHLLTGGQRIAQLVALETANIKDNAITLMDAKGRPGKAPRPHTVPLNEAAATALAECKPVGVYALSHDGGKTHLGPTTLSGWAQDVAKSIPDFQAKRIRSGVETLLASAKVSTEIRGRLQSHGITGVQARHYDGHDYLPEKRHALETLCQLLDAPDQTNVLPLRKAG